jgi:hypothetical protein
MCNRMLQYNIVRSWSFDTWYGWQEWSTKALVFHDYLTELS